MQKKAGGRDGFAENVGILMRPLQKRVSHARQGMAERGVLEAIVQKIHIQSSCGWGSPPFLADVIVQRILIQSF